MQKKVLISPSSFGKCGKSPLDLLVRHDYEYILNPYARKMTSDEVVSHAKDCIGIIAGVESLNADVLDALKALKCISRVGVGLDSVS